MWLATTPKTICMILIQMLLNTVWIMCNREKTFLKNIQIFTLHKQRFTSFTLVNPVIGSWSHDNLDQADGQGIMQNTMQIFYETVLYGAGVIKKMMCQALLRFIMI
jgi:hypothetical protein